MERITFQKLLDSLGLEGAFKINQELNIWMILINLAVAFAVVMFIYFIYKATFTGVLYSKNFNITLVVVSLVTTSAVIIISSNIILALGMVGALSIVRFRMAVKDPKDIGFLFWAITNGIICGISAYGLAVVSSLFIGLIVFALSKKIRILEPYLLIVNLKGTSSSSLEDVLSKNTITYKIRSRVAEAGSTQVITEMRVRKDKLSILLEKIRDLGEVTYTKLVSYEGDLEEA
ncbi:MAG: DUF4956 domain-containing protein [Actinobacteria bacterium]|nr:DUF4956 domain-containing protein [Actinomycetota bacterium]